MFENFTRIPHTDNDLSQMMEPMHEISQKFKSIIPSNSHIFTWWKNYINLYLGEMLHNMCALTATEEKGMHTYYYDDDEYNFRDRYSLIQICGIVINEAPSTKFNASHYVGAQYLEGAQDFIKQTSHHFLKIFTNPANSILYIWTNKPLTSDSIYHIFALYQSIYNQENILLKEFLERAIANDAEGARKLLSDYFTSDEMIKREFQTFKKCLQHSSERQIGRIEREIANLRDRISDYENEIASMATKMREQNEKLSFLKYMQPDNDDHLLFFKHLKKIPYLKSFKGEDEGYLYLEYEAPIVYFADYPAEKLLQQPQRSNSSKEIIKMIIGRKYELITKCAICFNTINYQTNATSIENTANVTQHPHIARYHCFGNHRQAIHESAESGDYIGAIEQITQAVLNLNFYDTCVIDTLCRELMRDKTTLKTWKNKETGEMLTTEEVLQRGDYYEET